MPDEKVQITLEFRENGSVVIKDAEKAISRGYKGMGDAAQRMGRRSTTTFDRMRKHLRGLRQSIFSVKTAVVGLAGGAGFYLLARQMEKNISLSNRQETALATMKQAMIANNKYTEEFYHKLVQLSEGLQKVTTFGDEATQEGIKFLLTYKQISNEELPRAIKLMTDLAALMGGDMKQAANMVGKAAMGMSGELRRVGITVDEDIAKGGDFVAIMAEIEKQAGGQAEALRRTGYGGLVALGNATDDVREKLGSMQKDVIAPFVQELLEGFTRIDDKMGEFLESGEAYENQIIAIQKQLRGMAVTGVGAAQTLVGIAPPIVAGLKTIANGSEIVRASFGGWSAVWLKLKYDFADFVVLINQGYDTLISLNIKLNKTLAFTRTQEQQKAIMKFNLEAQTSTRQIIADYTKYMQQYTEEADKTKDTVVEVIMAIEAQYKKTGEGAEKAIEQLEGLKQQLLGMEFGLPAEAGGPKGTGAGLDSETESLKANNAERDKLVDTLRKEEAARKDLQTTMANQLGELETLGANKPMLDEMWEAIEAGDKNLYDQLHAYYKDHLTKQADAAETAQAEMQKRNEEAVRTNQEMLDKMEDSWREYMNIVLAEYDDFGDMAKAIGWKLMVDLAGSVMTGKPGGIENILAGIFGGGGSGGGIMDMFGIQGISGPLENVAGSTGSLQSMFSKIIGPEGLLVKTEPVMGPVTAEQAAAGVQPGTQQISGLTGLGKGLGVAGGLYGVYSAYESGSPESGLTSGATAGFAVGGPWGAAIGAGIGLAGGFFGKKSQEAEQRRKERAQEYFTELQEVAQKEYDTLKEIMGDIDDILSPKHIGAAIKYGDLEAAGIEELFNVASQLEGYKETVEEFGQSNLMAINSYHLMASEMENFSQVSKNWSGDAKAVAEQWEQIWQKMQQLQLKAVMDDLSEGSALFSSTMSKIEFLDLDEAEKTTLQYNTALDFLTTDTIPALSGELAMARDLFKETAEEMDKMAEAEEQLEMKTKILRSDLELTEGQLRAIKEGEVNLEAIKYAEAFGLWDMEIVLVNADLAETLSRGEAIEAMAESLQGTLQGLAAYFEGLDVSEDLQQTYEALYQVALGLELIGKTSSKIEATIDTLEEFIATVKRGEATVLDLNQAVLTTADMILYAASTTEQLAAGLESLNLAKGTQDALGSISAVLTGVGTFLVYLQMALELVLLLERGVQSFMAKLMENDEWAQRIHDRLDTIEERFPKMGEALREALLPPEREDVPGSIKDAFGMGEMTPEQAGSIYQKYAKEAGYTAETDIGRQVEDIQYQAEEAIRNVVQAMSDGVFTFEETLDIVTTIREGTAEEIAQLKDNIAQGITDALAVIDLSPLGRHMYDLNKSYQEQRQTLIDLGMPLDDLNTLYQKQKEQLLENFMQPIKDIIAMAGMSEYGKQLYDINQQTKGWIESLNDLAAESDMTAAEYAQNMQTINAANDILIKKLLENFMAPIESTLATAGMSDYAKRLYAIDQLTEDRIDNLTDMYQDGALSADEYARKLQKIGDAHNILATQEIEGLWDPVIDGIRKKLQSLEQSEYNLIPPAQRAEVLEDSFQDLAARMRSAEGEEFIGAYKDLEQTADSYLRHMLETYQSSEPYQQAYKEVMDILREAEARAAGQKQEMLSEYERQSLTQQGQLTMDVSQIVSLVAGLAEGQQGLTDTISDMSGFEESRDDFGSMLVEMQNVAGATGTLQTDFSQFRVGWYWATTIFHDKFSGMDAKMGTMTTHTGDIKTNTGEAVKALGEIKEEVQELRRGNRKLREEMKNNKIDTNAITTAIARGFEGLEGKR